jgi:hypothetical protein
VTEPVFDPELAIHILARHGVRFVVVGGFAANLLGSAIVTTDLDLCYARDTENYRRLASALQELNARLRGAPEDVPFILDAETIERGDRFTFTTDAGSLDVMGDPDGSAGYEALLRHALVLRVDDIEVAVASIDDLIVMKRASGRVKDRIHVEEFVALREEREALEARGIDPDAPPSG